MRHCLFAALRRERYVLRIPQFPILRRFHGELKTSPLSACLIGLATLFGSCTHKLLDFRSLCNYYTFWGVALLLLYRIESVYFFSFHFKDFHAFEKRAAQNLITHPSNGLVKVHSFYPEYRYGQAKMKLCLSHFYLPEIFWAGTLRWRCHVASTCFYKRLSDCMFYLTGLDFRLGKFYTKTENLRN